MDAITTSLSAAVIHNGGELGVEVAREVEMSIGDRLELHFRAIQTHEATYNIDGIPSSAKATPVGDGIDLVWTTKRGDAGDHDLRLTVKEGGNTGERSLRVHVEDTHHFAFMPGIVSTTLVPNNVPRLGVFSGGGAELVIYAYGQRSNADWPSSGRFYLDVIAAGSTQPGVSALFDAALGFDITLERSPRRRYLLPAVGLETGITGQGQTGIYGWGMGIASVYLFWSAQARVVLKGGYALPTTADQDTRGFRFGLSFDFGWW